MAFVADLFHLSAQLDDKDLQPRRKQLNATEPCVSQGDRISVGPGPPADRAHQFVGDNGFRLSSTRRIRIRALRARDLAPDPAQMRCGEMTEDYGYHSAIDMSGATHHTRRFWSHPLSLQWVFAGPWKSSASPWVGIHDDDLSYLKNTSSAPVFTSTRSSVRHAGQRAAKILLRLIEDPIQPPMTKLLKTNLIIGASKGPYLDQSGHARVP